MSSKNWAFDVNKGTDSRQNWELKLRLRPQSEFHQFDLGVTGNAFRRLGMSRLVGSCATLLSSDATVAAAVDHILLNITPFARIAHFGKAPAPPPHPREAAKGAFFSPVSKSAKKCSIIACFSRLSSNGHSRPTGMNFVSGRKGQNPFSAKHCRRSRRPRMSGLLPFYGGQQSGSHSGRKNSIVSFVATLAAFSV